MKPSARFLLPAITAALSISASAAEPVKPLRALLVIGGCCHDYATQKDLLEVGIEARANIEVDVCYSPEKGTTPVFACYEKDDWAAAYDVIIHDECAAGVKDPAMVKRILDPHRAGVPAVALHCAMHSFRVSPGFGKPMAAAAEGGEWFDFLGIQSSGHGKQAPIDISYVDPASPITQGLENWTTGNEELYNNLYVFKTAHVLASGTQDGKEAVVTWTNDYKGTRVFNTTIGHNNQTIADSRYLDLVTRGLLWATGKLDDQGRVVRGYGRRQP
jgi:type 1 glutamine amidotransferase